MDGRSESKTEFVHIYAQHSTTSFVRSAPGSSSDCHRRQHYIPHRKSDMVGGEVVLRAERRVSFTFRQVGGGVAVPGGGGSTCTPPVLALLVALSLE